MNPHALSCRCAAAAAPRCARHQPFSPRSTASCRLRPPHHVARLPAPPWSALRCHRFALVPPPQAE